MVIKPGAIYELAPDGRVMLEMQDVMSLVADVRRLEWLAKAEVFPMNTKEGWCLSGDGVTCWAKTNHSWRDAIDEAMEDE